MIEDDKRGEIPTYKDVVAGEGMSNIKLEEEIKT